MTPLMALGIYVAYWFASRIGMLVLDGFQVLKLDTFFGDSLDRDIPEFRYWVPIPGFGDVIIIIGWLVMLYNFPIRSAQAIKSSVQATQRFFLADKEATGGEVSMWDPNRR